MNEVKLKAHHGKALALDSQAISCRELRLTDPDISADLDAEIAAMRAKPDLAKQFLVELGVIGAKSGKLTKRFGG